MLKDISIGETMFCLSDRNKSAGLRGGLFDDRQEIRDVDRNGSRQVGLRGAAFFVQSDPLDLGVCFAGHIGRECRCLLIPFPADAETAFMP